MIKKSCILLGVVAMLLGLIGLLTACGYSQIGIVGPDGVTAYYNPAVMSPKSSYLIRQESSHNNGINLITCEEISAAEKEVDGLEEGDPFIPESRRYLVGLRTRKDC